MNNDYPKIEESEYKDLFSSSSFLPDSSRSNFEIRDLDIKIVFDAKSRTANWTKTYTLEKVRNNQIGRAHV